MGLVLPLGEFTQDVIESPVGEVQEPAGRQAPEPQVEVVIPVGRDTVFIQPPLVGDGTGMDAQFGGEDGGQQHRKQLLNESCFHGFDLVLVLIARFGSGFVEAMEF